MNIHLNLQTRSKTHNHNKNQQPDLTHRSDDVSSEQSIGFLVCKNFDESVGFADRLRAAVGDEGELADVVFDTL